MKTLIWNNLFALALPFHICTYHIKMKNHLIVYYTTFEFWIVTRVHIIPITVTLFIRGHKNMKCFLKPATIYVSNKCENPPHRWCVLLLPTEYLSCTGHIHVWIQYSIISTNSIKSRTETEKIYLWECTHFILIANALAIAAFRCNVCECCGENDIQKSVQLIEKSCLVHFVRFQFDFGHIAFSMDFWLLGKCGWQPDCYDQRSWLSRVSQFKPDRLYAQSINRQIMGRWAIFDLKILIYSFDGIVFYTNDPFL